MRCGVYVRVSTEDQRDNGYSIDSQLRMIKEYCRTFWKRPNATRNAKIIKRYQIS